MNLSQKIAFNTVVQFVGRIFTAVSTLVITVLIGGKLGPEVYGQYVRITSYITIWFVLLDFGINPIAVKAISKFKDLEKQRIALRENFKMLLGLRSAVTLVILIVATIILFLLPIDNYTPTIRTAILIGYIQIIGQSVVSSSMPVFQVTLTYFWATLSNLIGSLISLVLSSIVIWKGGSILEIVISSMVGWFVIAGATYYFAAKHTGFVFPEFDFRKWKGLLMKAFPVGLALLFNVVFVKLNMQLLQIFRLDEAVLDKYGSIDAQTGYYGISLRFFDILLTVPFFFSNAIYPILIQRKEESLQSLNDFTQKAMRIMFMAGFPIAIGGVILARHIVYFVSGGFLPDADPNDFLPAVPALQILIAGVGFFFSTGVISWTPIVMDKQWILTKIYAIIVLVNVILNIFLLPKYGYLGAVATTVFCEFVLLFLHGYYSNKLIGFKYDLAFIFKSLLAAIIMGGVIYYIDDTFVTNSYLAIIPLCVGIIVYLATGSVLGVVDINLVKSVLKIKGKPSK